MIVGAKQGQAVESTDKILHHGVSNRVAIKSRGPSAKLIKDGERTVGCKLQHVLSLFHFNVKSTFSFEDPVASSNPRKNSIDKSKFTSLCRHVAAYLS